MRTKLTVALAIVPLSAGLIVITAAGSALFSQPPARPAVPPTYDAMYLTESGFEIARNPCYGPPAATGIYRVDNGREFRWTCDDGRVVHVPIR